MSSEGGGKLRPKRSHAAPSKPYERKKSLLGKVADTVKEIFSPSWLTDLVANINKAPVKEDEEAAENEDKIKDPHETGLLSADSTGPSTSFRAYDYDPLRIRSNGQPRNQDFPSQAVPSLPTAVMSPLSEFTSAQLPLTRLVQKSDSMIVNDDNQSQRSDVSKSTSGCSSMIPHPDKKDYQSEVLQEEHSYSDISMSASASASTSHNPLQQQQHPSDKYQRVPVVEKTYAWTPRSSGIQHSKPQVPANRNQPSFNVSLFGSPIQADTSYMEQRFESSFYAGKTTYGGASAYKKARVNTGSPYQSCPVRRQIKPKPTNNTFSAVTSSTARRILVALEKMSTPVNDAKRFPVDSYLQGSFLAQNTSSNRSFAGQSSSRPITGTSGLNSSYTFRSEVKKGPPLNRIMVPEFATISKNRQKVTSPEVMAELDARIREENKARTVEVNSWSIFHQDTVAVKDLPTGASSGKMKRDKSYHKPAKKTEQDDMLSIPDLKTDFTLPLKELPKFQFTPTISGSKALESNLQKEKPSPKFTFSSPMKEVQPEEERHSASSSRSQEFKFSSPIKVDEEKKLAPSFNFVTITSSSGTSFSTSGCSFGVAISKPSAASSTEHGLMLKSAVSDTAPRVKEPSKSKVHHIKVTLTDPYRGVPYNMKKGSNVHEVTKWSTCLLQPATQLRNGSIKEILGKTAVPELKQGNNVLEVFKWNPSPLHPLQPATELKTTSFTDIHNPDQLDGDASASNMKQGSNVPKDFLRSTSPLQPATQLMTGRVKDIFGKTDPYDSDSSASNTKQGSNVPKAVKWSTSPLQPATKLMTGRVIGFSGKTDPYDSDSSASNTKQGSNVSKAVKWSTSPLQPATKLMTGQVIGFSGKTDPYDSDSSASNTKQGSNVSKAVKWSTSPLQPATKLMTGRVIGFSGKTAVPELKQGNNVLEVFKWNPSPLHPLQPATELKTTSFMDIHNTDQLDGDASASNMKQGSNVPKAFQWSTSPLQPATQLMTGRVVGFSGKTDPFDVAAVPELKQGNNVLEAFKWNSSPLHPLQPATELKTTSFIDILNTDQLDGDASASNMKQGSNVPKDFLRSTSPLQPATQLMTGRVKDIFGKKDPYDSDSSASNMKQGSNVPKAFQWSTSPLQPATQLMTGRVKDIFGKTGPFGGAAAVPNTKQGSNVPKAFQWSTSPLQPATQLMTGQVIGFSGKTASPNTKQKCNVPEVFKRSTSLLQPANQLMTGRSMDILGKSASTNMKIRGIVSGVFTWSTASSQPAAQLMTGQVKDIFGKTAASDLKQGNTDEALKGSKSPFQPAAQLKAGSVMDILGKTDSSSPLPPSNYLFGKFQPAAGSWKCGVCLIQNKAEDTKCPACQTPKPTAPSKPTPTIGSNLGSLSTPAGSWKCDTCLIQNKAEVNKCAACCSAKPVKSTGSGFGFTTTPLVSAAPSGCWKCDTCLIQNKADVNRCAACGSAKPVKSTGSESSGHCLESYLNPFPPGNWICTSCLIQNKADAIKCGKCQTDKPTGKSGDVTKTDNSLADKFKPAVGSWACNICLVLNNGSSTKCVSCETEKPAPKTGDSFMNSFKKPQGTWDCEICLVTNKPTAIQCIACDSPRPGEKPKHLVPSVAGFKIAAGAFSQNSGFNLPGVAQKETSAPSLFKFGSTSVKSDTTTTTTAGPVGFKFGDSFQSGTSSEMKTTQSTFKLGDTNTGTKTTSASVVDSQVKKVDLGNSDLKVGGETTAFTVETKSASTAVGGTTAIVFGQQQNVGSINDLHKENVRTEELKLKPSGDSNTSGSSTIKTGGFEFRFTPSSSNQSNSTSFASSTSTGGSSFNKPTIDSLDSSGQTLSESQKTSGSITTTSQLSTESNVSKLDSQQSSAPSSKAESLPKDVFNFKSSTLGQANAALDANKLAVGGFNFMAKTSEESKVENNTPFVFGTTANAVVKKSIFTLKPSSETPTLKRTNSGEESDAHQGGKRQAMGFGEGSAVNNATGVNTSNTSGTTGIFNFGQQNNSTSAPSFLSVGSTTASPFNSTGFGSSSPAAAAPTAAPVFNFTGQNSTLNSSVFQFTGQGSTTKSAPFPAFGSTMSTVSNTPGFGGTSQFSGQRDDAPSNMVTNPFGSTTGQAFGGFGNTGVTGTSDTAMSPLVGASNSNNAITGMESSSSTQFTGNGFGSSTASTPGFGGSSVPSFGVSAPVFGGNTSSQATTTAGFSFNASSFNSTTQNSTFQFNAKPIDSKPQQQSGAGSNSVFVFGHTPAASKPQQQSGTGSNSVFVFGQTPAVSKPQQQLVAPPSSVFVFGQTPADSKLQQQSGTGANSVFVFGQTPAVSKPQQQLVAPPSSVFVFGQTPADSKPQLQSGTSSNSVFAFGQSQTNTSNQAAPASGPFNFNSQPVFNFTGASTTSPFNFSFPHQPPHPTDMEVD